MYFDPKGLHVQDILETGREIPSLAAQIFPPIPMDTAKAARAVFGSSNFYLMIGDQANSLFEGLHLGNSLKWAQIPERSLAMFYLVTTFQFLETLPDHLAMDALQKRVDWKYALHLPLNHLSLEAGAFCKFRQWLRASQTGQHDFQELLKRMPDQTAFICCKDFNTEASQVLSMVCLTSRLGKIWEVLNQALEVLAIRRPDWLVANSLPHWYERYGRGSRYLNLRLDYPEKRALAEAIGADGFYLLEAITQAGDPELTGPSEVRELRRVWLDEFDRIGGKVLWKKEFCAGCSSPGTHPLSVDEVGQINRRWMADEH